ncbi:uncharacterized protein BP5553_05792 [Venustampulla echinocandica]|uniref:Thiol-specific monooxygenase n=1 Tax=Venustampulla echinocandica TaxID=2656787 RepID=A0A370TLP0_9HELO|nr:uncharacterized protein BP5553_05792 [Venustampulla echinocandica]RDL36440.1 hypothetical protein BP5553_05792 [Venustampulla echinocandica]
MGSILQPFASGRYDIRRIAIIGAGPSGLAAAKYLQAEECFEKIDIFEQQAEVGGVWHYIPMTGEAVPVPSTTPDVPLEKPIWPKDSKFPLFSNPMYDQLYTNIPKDLMRFSDQAFPSESLLFPTRQDVQKYLVQYSQGIRHLISFSTQVDEVHLSHGNGKNRWEVTSMSTITGESKQNEYDAVVVACGHYSVPYIPPVPGIEAFNSAHPTVITHSKIFRAPDKFANQKVIVVGNAASGLDIGTQISEVCKKPLLNSVRSPSAIKMGEEKKEELPPIVEYLVDQRGVRFEDGRIEKDIDAIVYCTGYLYSYPFLETIKPSIVTTGRRALGLYQHVFNIAHPSLAFTALPQKVIPFPVSEAQGAAIATVWSNKLGLPAKDEMEAWEKDRAAEHGEGTSFHILEYPHDGEYINKLHDWVKSVQNGRGKEPPFWTPREFHLREIFATLRQKFAEGGHKARTIEELGFKFEGPDEEKTL